MAAVAAVAVVAVNGDDGRLHGTRGVHGTRVVHFTIRSRLLHRTQRETLVIPPGSPASRPPLLIMLHGRGPEIEPTNQFLDALRVQGRLAPAVVLPSDDGSSYWHDRASGDWGRYVMDKVLPAALKRSHADPKRVAIGGISMGGVGAYDLARLHPTRFCAVGGHSPALWDQSGETAEGAYDDAEDFARHDVIGAAHANPHLFGHAKVWLDAGTSDPFDPWDKELLQILRTGGVHVSGHRWPGAHENVYWNAHWKDYLAFYATALGDCRGS